MKGLIKVGSALSLSMDLNFNCFQLCIGNRLPRLPKENPCRLISVHNVGLWEVMSDNMEFLLKSGGFIWSNFTSPRGPGAKIGELIY
jgi:hypothetical protein